MKKTAIITGASRGIGYAAAKKLGMDGCQVVLFATGEKERYKAAIDGLTQAGITWHYVRGSLDCREDRERLIRETVEKFGRIDILVNNAGVAPKERKDLLEMSEESFDRVLGINALLVLPDQRPHLRQVLNVNVGSCSAEVSSTSRGEYCVSKAAVSMLTTLFADRLAPEGILVNEVRPGVIATDMTSVVTEKYDTMIKNGVFPIARWGKAEDVAEMIAFFCSDSVLYTTGNYVDVDGGFHIKRL